MTKGVLKELVLITLNGGTLNDESAILRVDIEAYLPAAVNYAMSKAYNINLQVEGYRDMSSLFYGSFPNLNIVRPDGLPPRVLLPKGTVALPRNQGVRFVLDNCGNTYTPLQDADLHTVKYYSGILSCERFFRLKQTWIDLFNVHPLAEKVGMEMIVRTEDLLDTDELPIQAGLEDDVIALCVKRFSPQREIEADKINNSVDINTQP